MEKLWDKNVDAYNVNMSIDESLGEVKDPMLLYLLVLFVLFGYA